MKILVIVPNITESFVRDYLEIEKELFSDSFSVQLEVIGLENGPVSLETGYDEALALPELINRVEQANRSDFDAICIDCAADPGHQVLRELSKIPVVFAGEASYYFALALGGKFSLITVIDNTKTLNQVNIAKYCLQERVASVRSSNVPVLDVHDDLVSYNSILIEAEKAIENDGAQVIVLGCTGMSKHVPSLQEKLGVPVVDPRRAALHLAMSLVSMNLSHSKRAFMELPLK